MVYGGPVALTPVNANRPLNVNKHRTCCQACGIAQINVNVYIPLIIQSVGLYASQVGDGCYED